MEKFDKWLTLLIGLVGGWVISTAPGWLHASGHEHWWDIATALGTVGAVAVALGAHALQGRRERLQKRKDSALAVYSEKDRILKMRLNLSTCLHTLKSKESEFGDTPWAILEEALKALDGKLHPRYAEFDRAFIRHLLDARSALDEAHWLCVIGDERDPLMAQHLRRAIKKLQMAEEVCDRARDSMESWWA